MLGLSIRYLADAGESYLEAVEAVWLATLGPILLPTQLLVAAQATEVVEMPVLVLGTRVLSTHYQLHKCKQRYLYFLSEVITLLG